MSSVLARCITATTAALFYIGMIMEMVRHGTAVVALLLIFMVTVHQDADPKRVYDLEFDY